MPTGSIRTATAFWSYAHSDDEGSNEQIRRLKEQVDHAYKRHRGEALASFFDRNGKHKIEWGEEWRTKISTTISGTTFFIPIVSPSYVKSTMCREEFDEFSGKAAGSDLNELLMPILWVPIHPETEEELRIFNAAKERQWIDWTQVRKLDEDSARYRALIDEMGERLAQAARSVAGKPEVAEPSPAPKLTNQNDKQMEDGSWTEEQPDPRSADSPGLVDLAAEAMTQAESFAEHVTNGFNQLSEMNLEVLQKNPLHPSASAGQRQFYFKRIANEITPYADEFETSIKAAADDASELNDTMLQIVEMLKDPSLRQMINTESIGQVKEIPATLAAKFGDYQKSRVQISAVGRMSRDLRPPFASIERAYDSMDEIMRSVEDWTTAFKTLE